MSGDECVFVDPVRLSDEALARLPKPSAVVLNARTHQRAAWRYRRECGAEVWLPEDAPPADEEPDHATRRATSCPAASSPSARRALSGRTTRCCARAAPASSSAPTSSSHEGGGELLFIPPEYHDDPAETRRSVRRLLDLPFDVLCFDHGVPIARDPKRSLRRLLEASG